MIELKNNELNNYYQIKMSEYYDDEMIDKFLDVPDDNIETPESLAWKLLLDNTFNDFATSIIPCVDGYNDDNSYLEDQFQILITVYLEMIFNTLKLMHIGVNNNQDDKTNIFESFQPSLNNVSINDLTDEFRAKFKKIRYFLHVQQINNDYQDYYCKVILKNSINGKLHYELNKNNIDQSKYYTFAINRNFAEIKKYNKKLESYYAICHLPHMSIKIFFSQININP